MKLGKLKIFILFFSITIVGTLSSFAVDKIESVPLINLEELSPTFEEDKEILEKVDDQNTKLNKEKNINEAIKDEEISSLTRV